MVRGRGRDRESSDRSQPTSFGSVQGVIVDQQAGKQYAELTRVAKAGDRSAAPTEELAGGRESRFGPVSR